MKINEIMTNYDIPKTNKFKLCLTPCIIFGAMPIIYSVDSQNQYLFFRKFSCNSKNTN